MLSWAKDLYPICRSITGPGVRETLQYIKKLLPELNVFEVASGTKAFDWVVPDEWTIQDAYILDENKNRVIDFNKHNLHVIGYATSIDKTMSLEELSEHLYSIPEQPDAIPYITSYYEKRWGFCLTENQRKSMLPGTYRAVINSRLAPGVLNYAEVLIKGERSEEVLLSTYICHPSMANNELSGPVVTIAIANWLKNLPRRRYTYRIIFVPETIGSIVYISKNLEKLKKNVISGYNITCVGDDRNYSYLPSRSGDGLADQAAKHVLRHIDRNYKIYSWLDRGSDERQYCAHGVDLKIASVMRTKYGEYSEYHTSQDDFNLVTETGLEGGYNAIRKCLEIFEFNFIPISTVTCEPQLGRRGLYPTLSTSESNKKVKIMMDFLTYCDGKHSLLEIADLINVEFWHIFSLAQTLKNEGLIIEGSESGSNQHCD